MFGGFMSIRKTVVRLPNSLYVQAEQHVSAEGRDNVILVNGALATTASFGQTIKYLSERYNVVCFDLPYAGQSRQHNPQEITLTKDDEVEILLHVIRRFQPKFLYSVSWGGLASLLALSQENTSVERAVIGSFSPFLNDAMVDYVTRARDHLHVGEYLPAAHLLNDTVGKHLPRIMKLLNYRYLTSIPKEQHAQVAFHAEQILALRPESYVDKLVNIKSRIKFVNGELDEYTTTQDIRTLARYVTNVQFVSVPNTGHFLELEGRTQAAAMRDELLDFFRTGRVGEQPRAEATVVPAFAQTFASSDMNLDLGSGT
ncbi:MAG: rhamnosyltransferase subunit [Caballeronia sp.]|nr:rhamnosyltransferase subunit [Caballeronia sp.]